MEAKRFYLGSSFSNHITFDKFLIILKFDLHICKMRIKLIASPVYSLDIEDQTMYLMCFINYNVLFKPEL